MPTKKIQNLRYCRYPLLIGIAVSGLLILRVPVAECFTRGPEEITQQDRALADVSSTAVDLTTEAVKPVTPVADPVAGNAAETITPTPIAPGEVTGVEPVLPSLAEAQQAFRGHAALARGILNSVPKVLEGVAKVTEVTGGFEVPAEVVTVETPEVTPPPQQEAPVEAPVEATAPQKASQIVIRNSAESSGVIRFLAGDDVLQLHPGEELQVAAEEKVHVQFHRGGKFGNAESWLSTAGVYEFSVSNMGWTLTPLADTSR